MDRTAASSAAALAGPEELKQQMYSQLKKAGVVSALKSQLRIQLLEQLRKLAGPDAVRAAGTGAAGSDQARSMWHAALNCMLAEYLQASNLQFTLSVFNSETDTVPGQHAFSAEELCQLLRLDRQPQLLQRVQELLPSQGCLVLALLQALASSGGGPTTADSACQTSRAGQLDGVKGRLLQLEDAYMAKAAQKAVADPRLSLDQQMAAYKKECDELAELQVAARVARMREVELAAARQEAAAKYRQQLEADRLELERIHAERLARLAAREEAVSEQLRRQQRDVEGLAYSQRQRILAEEDRLRHMKAEVGRQLEVQEQLMHGLEAQLKKRERGVSARELAAESKLAEAAELETKLAAAARKDAAAALSEERAALRGERVALEAERARVSELRSAVNADLAVARAHEDRLRTLEAARAEAEARSAAHAAGEEVLRLQLKVLQAEAAALQQELLRTGAAAGAAAAATFAAGGAEPQQYTYLAGGGAPLQLPQALRELGQWQQRAQQAELLAEQVAVERDAAQSRADELSLDLNAARRDIAALRNQLARQQQDILQLKLQLSQAAATAAAAAAVGGSGGGGSWGGSLAGRPGSPRARGAAAAAATAAAAASRPDLFAGHRLGAGSAGGAAVSPAGAMRQQQQGFGSPQHPQQRGVRSLGGAAEETQAASARLAQLSAADASLTQRLADFRRRSAAQRAAAARQLADLRAVSSGGGGAGDAAASPSRATGYSGGGCLAAAGVQRQCRLSIPSEYDGFVGREAELAELDAEASQELQQQQQRREALELSLRPQQQQQQQQAWVAGSWPAMPVGATAAAGGARVVPLSDALGIAAAGFLPQQKQQQEQVRQQQAMHQQQQEPQPGQQQQRLQGAGSPAASYAEHSFARPPSSSTQFSFVQQTDHGGVGDVLTAVEKAGVSDEAGTQRSSSGLQQEQHEVEVIAQEPPPGIAMAEAQQVAAAAAGEAQAAAAAGEAQAAAALCSNAGSNAHQQQPQQQVHLFEQPSVAAQSLSAVPAAAAAAAAAGVPAATPPSAGEATADEASTSAADVRLPPGVAQVDADLAECAVEALQHQQQHQPAAGSKDECDDEAAAYEREHDEAAVHGEAGDAFAGGLSASSSAVGLEAVAAAAAGLEGVRLSSSSTAASSSRSVDRYASWAAGGYEEEEDEDEEDDQDSVVDMQQEYVVAAGAPEVAAQHYLQQPQQQQGLAGWQGPEVEEEGLRGLAAEQRQPSTPTSPGWLGEAEHMQAGQQYAEDASSESGGGGGGVGGDSGWAQEPLSPGSSNGSVF